ncbi:MAG: hypothetical protein QM627_00780 [Luteolibacter sp.]
MTHLSSGYHALLLWLMTFLFFTRVVGQILVGIYAPTFLPPWSEWYSGLLPYPWLLICQILLLMLMTAVNTDTIRQSGRFHVSSPRAVKILRVSATIYASIMIVRYAVVMTFNPEQRWFGGTIPIVFHLILAFWIFLLSVRSGEKE